ncbi:hypothetical protein GA0115260_107301, partial [Streptomyces sp. MnatMP-M27]
PCGSLNGQPSRLAARDGRRIRRPMLSINPKMPPRLDKLETDLQALRQRAITEGWRGEVEGLALTLSLAFNVGGLGVP